MNRRYLLAVLFFVLVFRSAASHAGQPGQHDFRVDGERLSYKVIVVKPDEERQSYPLVIFHHGLAGFSQKGLRKIGRHFAEEGYLFWAPVRPQRGPLQRAIDVAGDSLQRALESPGVDTDRITVVGFSQGSVASLYAAHSSPHVKVICLLGFGSHKKSGRVENMMERMDFDSVFGKILILNAGRERQVDTNTYKVLTDYLDSAEKEYKIISYPRYGHTDFYSRPDHLKDVTDYLDQNLPR